MARRKSHEVPGYLLHKTRGTAYSNLGGKVVYHPGPYGSEKSVAAYNSVVSLWTLNGGKLPDSPTAGPGAVASTSPTDYTIAHLADAYLTYAESYYRKEGIQTTQVRIVRDTLRILLPLFGTLPVTEFGPLKLALVCEAFIAKGWCRSTVIKHLSVIKAMFRWGTAQEKIAGSVYHSLQAYQNPKQGRSKAREAPDVEGVPDEVVEATLPHLPPVVADLVRVQRLTGMRPSEALMLRRADIKQEGTIWKYTPTTHKNAHHGISRLIAIGPRAQAIINAQPKAAPDAFIFSYNGGVDRYDQAGYRRAIQRGCERAFQYPAHLAPKVIVPTGRKKQPRLETPAEWRARLTLAERAEVKAYRDSHRWHPNQLRHTLADAVRDRFQIDASQVVLGHSKPTTTAIYASNNFKRAAAIMAQVG